MGMFQKKKTSGEFERIRPENKGSVMRSIGIVFVAHDHFQYILTES